MPDRREILRSYFRQVIKDATAYNEVRRLGGQPVEGLHAELLATVRSDFEALGIEFGFGLLNVVQRRLQGAVGDVIGAGARAIAAALSSRKR